MGPIMQGTMYALESGERQRDNTRRQEAFNLDKQRAELGLSEARRAQTQRSELDNLRKEMFYDKVDPSGGGGDGYAPSGPDAQARYDSTTQYPPGTGSTPQYTPKKFGSDSDRLKAITEFGQRAMMSMDMSPEQIMAMSDRIKHAQDEGRMDAVHALVNSGGDINAAKKVFNASGDEEIVGTMPTKVKDHFGERDAYIARIRNKKTGEERIDKIDPYTEAYQLGGIKGAQKLIEDTMVSRRTAVAERRADTADTVAANQSTALIARLDQQDRRLDQGDRHLGIEQQRATAYANRVSNAVNGTGRASVFDTKRLAFLAVHPDDEEGALEYASGRKSVGPADLRLAAERMANSLKDPKTGMSLDANGRKQQADMIYARLIQGIPARPGAPLPAEAAKQVPRRPLKDVLGQ